MPNQPTFPRSLHVLVLAAFTAAAALAGDNSWTPLDLAQGGDATALAVDPGEPATMFAAMAGGAVYKTTDRAATWRRVARFNQHVTALAIDPVGPAIYACFYSDEEPGHDAGVVKSTDGGATWSPMNAGLQELQILELAIAPSDPAVLYVGAADGMYRTDDGGASWRRVLEDYLVLGIVVDPFSSDVVYATTSRGVAWSTDGGASWTPAGDGVPDDADSLAMAARSDPAIPPTLYAGSSSYSNNGVYRSTDGGDHWALAGLAAHAVTEVTADPARPGTAYASTSSAGLFKTVDGGATWGAVLPSRDFIETDPVAIDPGGDMLVVAMAGGIVVSEDGGGSWTRRSAGMAAHHVRSVAFDAGSDDVAYAASAPGGAYRSSDGGATWSATGSGSLSDHAWTVATDPVTPGVAYVGTWYDGLFKTTDGGASWVRSSNGLPSNPCGSVFDVAIDPSTPTTLYLASHNCNYNFVGVYKSTDGGASWSDAGGPKNVRGVAIDPRHPATLFATSDGVHRTTDGGATWSWVYQDHSPWARDVVVDPSTPGTVYAVGGELLKSTDDGDSWTKLPTAGMDVESLAIDPSDSSTLYLGAAEGGVFRSTDGGATWSALSEGLGKLYVGELAIDPRHPSTVLAGTWGASLWSLTSGPSSIVAGPGPGPANPNRVRLLDANGALKADWVAYGAGGHGTEVAGGNLDAGAEEIVTGPGPGEVLGPQVRAFSGDGAPLAKVNFYAYATLRHGVQPATGDVDGDGHAEIVTGPGPGSVFGPHVRGWDYGGVKLAPIPRIGFFAYSTPRYGVEVAAADVDGDGASEVLTGPGPGPSFGPHLRGFDDDGAAVRAVGRLSTSVWNTLEQGLHVAAGDVDGDGRDEGIFGPGPGAALDATVRGLTLDAGPPRLVPGIDELVFPGLGYGLEPGSADLGGDGDDEILCGQGASPGASSRLRGFDHSGGALKPLSATDVDAFGTGFSYGLDVASAGLGR